MKILLMYSEVMSYTIAQLQSLVSDFKAEVHVVHWDKKKLTPFAPPPSEGIHYYSRSSFSDKQLLELVTQINPVLCYVSGWMDAGYLKAAKVLKKKIPVLGGIDNQWQGTARQRLGCLLSPLKVKPYFSHLLAAGIYQYEFARRLGYSKDRILLNLYSANVPLFEQAFYNRNVWKKNILFVGRFHEIKGIELLLQCFNDLQQQFPDWSLTLIGNGPLKERIPTSERIKIKDFMGPEALVAEAMEASVFCLPSRKEPWGVVIHEFAATGLPIITSNICGASTEFVRNNYNGCIFENGDPESLKRALAKMMSASPEILKLMGKRSHQLSQHITPQIWAANIMSLLNV